MSPKTTPRKTNPAAQAHLNRGRANAGADRPRRTASASCPRAACDHLPATGAGVAAACSTRAACIRLPAAGTGVAASCTRAACVDLPAAAAFSARRGNIVTRVVGARTSGCGRGVRAGGTRYATGASNSARARASGANRRVAGFSRAVSVHRRGRCVAPTRATGTADVSTPTGLGGVISFARGVWRIRCSSRLVVAASGAHISRGERFHGPILSVQRRGAQSPGIETTRRGQRGDETETRNPEAHRREGERVQD